MWSRRLKVLLAGGLALLTAYAVLWSQADRSDDKEVRELTADLNESAAEIDRTLASLPERPGPGDTARIVELVRKSEVLVKRIEAVTPRLTESNSAEYGPARDRFLGSLQALTERLQLIRAGAGP